MIGVHHGEIRKKAHTIKLEKYIQHGKIIVVLKGFILYLGEAHSQENNY